ncbi:acyl-CoA N-acyltransferase [Pluteus cervinus]|uniref:Acyl-CoA N-acyltransferase n=1 Tax=Pluteus cervinus TaxID=181527 RepID=A0ACD3BFQ0_9AGAR|nr:acyl-CoA N-acyltransferase [Pluteus cervinus]
MSCECPMVWEAIQASSAQLMAAILANAGDDPNLQSTSNISYAVFRAQELSFEYRQMIWDILEENMAAMFIASTSFKWDPEGKRGDLFHPDSRFIAVLDEESKLIAYTMFRFEYEDEEMLIYCYELQVVPSGQGGGLGKRLMRYLAVIGTEWHMQKLMLTVFNNNAPAMELYRKLGFVADSTSPYPGEIMEDGGIVDYSILSVSL